ncbi:MAG: 1-(5-phosphoribosyl)-5-[(5-phosphoribosylamino)methylideneamino]imidazole-4-carboxamide isomerase [Cyclobacteriaceae bacterium]
MKIIPAIDIIGGNCVRLTHGDYDQMKQYSDDPLEIARRFELAGLTNLHMVDLDGAKAKHVINIDTLRKVAGHTNLHIDFGGGVKTRKDLDLVLEAGAKQVTAGSIAASDRNEVVGWIKEYGGDKIILGADVLHEKIMVSGWQKSSGEDLIDFLAFYIDQGIQSVICTDISKDGALQGPSFDLYKKIQDRFPNLNLIASGGVSNIEDLERLKSQGLYGTILGKAYYEGRVTLEQLKEIAC